MKSVRFEHKGGGARLTNVTVDNYMKSWANKTYSNGAWYQDFNGQTSLRARCFNMPQRSTMPKLSWLQEKTLSSLSLIHI